MLQTNSFFGTTSATQQMHMKAGARTTFARPFHKPKAIPRSISFEHEGLLDTYWKVPLSPLASPLFWFSGLLRVCLVVFLQSVTKCAIRK